MINWLRYFTPNGPTLDNSTLGLIAALVCFGLLILALRRSYREGDHPGLWLPMNEYDAPPESDFTPRPWTLPAAKGIQPKETPRAIDARGEIVRLVRQNERRS